MAHVRITLGFSFLSPRRAKKFVETNHVTSSLLCYSKCQPLCSAKSSQIIVSLSKNDI